MEEQNSPQVRRVLGGSLLFITIGALVLISKDYIANILIRDTNLTESGIYFYIDLLVAIGGMIITLSGVALALITLMFGVDSIEIYFIKLRKVLLSTTSLILTVAFAVILIYLIFTCLVIPSDLFLYTDSSGKGVDKIKMATAQILTCVGASGMLGGVVKVIFSSRILDETEESASFRVSFKKVIFNSIGSLFVAITSFLLIRAGVLKNVDVDTFNPYGVTGIAAVTGYFSDQIINRLSTVYTNIFSLDASKNKLDSR